ncbi:serine/threonine protein kinase [Kitasatospora purpeofusca]|uniref:serine/threonine protein kinase n=1 Tax=Kitasatospora purpeofusca TaxID=67352 RepID=UPI0022539960|nr:serine/threonine-protein kinase [Kitasatospora purpeofusca]MCX4689545.1 serine/threonine protein kinase [Kitasatospora purpeofusca]
MEYGKKLAGRFRIEERMTTGGTGVVYRATDLAEGGEVVVKALNVDSGPDFFLSREERRTRTQSLRRFHAEWKMLQKAAGPGIPRPIHAELDAKPPYLIMEYVDGEDLSTLLGTGLCSLDDVISIAVSLLRVIERLGSLGIVHRDLKPRNVRVRSSDSTIFVLDLGSGLDKETDDDSRITLPCEHSPLSIGYAAPELLRKHRNPESVADVYSIGNIMHRCITGKRYFEETDTLSIQDQQLKDMPPRIDPVVYSIPPPLAVLIWRMGAPDPRNRATAREALEYLESLLPHPGAPEAERPLKIDVTLPFRRPAGYVHAPAVPARPSGPRRPSVRRRRELTPAVLRTLLELAESELAAIGPGTRCTELAVALADSSGVQPPEPQLAARARLVEADRARAEGRWAAAAEAYRHAQATLRDTDEPAALALAVEARIGSAECLAVGEADPSSAYRLWSAAVADVARFARPPARLAARARELGGCLADLGVRAELEALLARLPTS